MIWQLWLAYVLAAARPFFVEVTDDVGIHFRHVSGKEGGFHLPEVMAAGGGFLDFDGDGDLDVYLVQSGSLEREGTWQNRLYRQEADHTFRDVTEQSGLGDSGFGMGMAVGDIDNDGWLDVYVTNFGADALYRNLGDGRFADATAEAGLSGEGWSTSAVFCDYDGDGFLDLYVVRYVQYDRERRCTSGAGSPEYCGPQVFPAASDFLYRNRGNGRFADVSLHSGIRNARGPGLGVVCTDLNGDGRRDFYVANDGAANHLWENDGDGHFVERAFFAGVALNTMGHPEAGMGIAPGDTDGDGDLDLFVTHLVDETNTFYVNDAGFGFDDRTAAAGLAAPSLPYTGFGTAFLDVEHDGDLDLAVVNGAVKRGKIRSGADVDEYWAPYAEPNQLFVNDATGRFHEAVDRVGDFGARVEVSRGLAVGDVDNDGDLDLLVTQTDGRARLFRNDAEKQGHWLSVRLLDPKIKGDAYGARVVVTTNDAAYVREVNPGFSYLVSNDVRVHIALPRDSRVENVEVLWPDGSREAFLVPVLDRHVVLERGAGKKPR